MPLARVVLLALSATGAAAAPGKHGWWHDMKERASNAFADDSAPPVTPEELLRESKSLKVESCGRGGDAMLVEGVDFDLHSLEVKVRGALSREVLGGNVSTRVSMGELPGSLSLRAKAMHTAAWLMRRSLVQPLCGAVKGANETKCRIAQGTKELTFAVRGIPSAVVAGEYTLTFKAVDEKALPVACVKAALRVPVGLHGESLRMLQSPYQSDCCYYNNCTYGPCGTVSGVGKVLSPLAGFAAAFFLTGAV